MWSCLYVPNSPRETNSSCRTPQLPLVRKNRGKKSTLSFSCKSSSCLFVSQPSIPGPSSIQTSLTAINLSMAKSCPGAYEQHPAPLKVYQHLNFNRGKFPPSLSLKLRIASKKPTHFPKDKSWQNPSRFCR